MQCGQTASAYRSGFSLAFASLSYEAVQPLHLQQPAVNRPKVTDLDDEENAVAFSSFSLEVGSPLENWSQLVNRTDALWLDYERSSSVKSSTHSLSIMKVEHKSMTMAKTSLEKEGVKAGVESSA